MNFKTYTAIFTISSSVLRIYHGMQCSTGRVSVKYMGVDSEMVKVMASSLKISVEDNCDDK